MTEGTKVAANRPLTLAEERALDQQIQEAEDQLDEVERKQGINYTTENREATENKLRELRKVRASRAVVEASGREREKIEAEANAIRSELQKDMPSWAEYSMTTRKDGPKYIRLKNLIVKWELDPVRRQKVSRWKYLRRRLDPSDPQIANTMYLFPGAE